MGRRGAGHGVWRLVAEITTALGLACCVAEWGLWRPVAIWIAVVVTVASVVLALVGTNARASARVGITCGLVTMACAGLVAAFGWSGAVVALVVAVTSPVVRIGLQAQRMASAMRSQAGSTDTTASGAPVSTLSAVAGMPSADGVLRLDDPALCEVWRRSYVRLQGSQATDARLEVVRLRQQYLDELVRRHPAEVRQWFASGARAAGNPLPYLGRPRHPHGTSEDPSCADG